jgi:alpha-galactosidase
VGAERLVIDDGWMPKRSSSEAGLGDWVADPEKFPHGLSAIADACHEKELLFGLWVEPEMVNPDSDLYRAHPDWVLSEPNRDRTLFRNQYIIDMSRDEIRDWVIKWLDELIVSAKLDYLKWDMNRSVSEVGLYARERGVAVKYIKNIMRIWEHLNEKFPDLLLENCAAGGGRADFGMVAMADRTNRSDNADPIDVMKLHEGFTTFFVPRLAGGAGNIAPSPYRNSRCAPLEYRIHLGMTGSMSIGIDLLKATEEELDKLRAATDTFKPIRKALQNSYVYRIASAWDNPYAIFEYCARDKSCFTVFAFGHGLNRWNYHMPLFRMRGLEPDAIYEYGDIRMSGAALMNVGIKIPLMREYVGCDYASLVMTFTRVK